MKKIRFIGDQTAKAIFWGAERRVTWWASKQILCDGAGGSELIQAVQIDLGVGTLARGS